jgi:hypothetical protein
MDIDGATLFKRRKTASAVAQTLGDRYQIEEVKLGRDNRAITRSRKRVVARRTIAAKK